MDYIQRQNKLIESFDHEVAIIVCSGDLNLRNGDSYYPFRAHSDFLYLTGIAEPQSSLLLYKKSGRIVRILIILDPPFQKRLWDSSWQLTVNSPELSCYDYVYNWGHKNELMHLAKIITAQDFFYHEDLCVDASIFFKTIPFEKNKIKSVLATLRLIKSEKEIEIMDQACVLSSTVYKKIYETDPALWTTEAVIEGFWIYEGKKLGVLHQAYSPIIAGGERACCLHYQKNNHTLLNDTMVLMDAGFEYQHYASDMTRMIFLKKPSFIQAALYNLLLDIQLHAIALIRPGITIAQIQHVTQEKMAQGLRQLHIFEGSIEKIIKNDLAQCYMHGIGHHLGLDVHDCTGLGDLKTRPLQAGMIITVEPGFYFSPTVFKEHYCSGLGMRIEDDVLVEIDGYRVLSSAPKNLEAICYGR
jgi:Xaa-Pro aminopeptidase